MACARLEAATYPDARVADLLRQYVPVKVDFTVDEDLGNRYGVQSSPDIFLLTPKGDVVNRITRFVSAPDLAEFLGAGLLSPERHLSPESMIPWRRSYADAMKESNETGTPIFVYVWNYG